MLSSLTLINLISIFHSTLVTNLNSIFWDELSFEMNFLRAKSKDGSEINFLWGSLKMFWDELTMGESIDGFLLEKKR